MDIFKESDGKPIRDLGSNKKRKFCSNVLPKYTSGGATLTVSSKEPAKKGWTEEGIKRFNDLFEKVKTDRKENRMVVPKWIRDKQKENKKSKKKRKRSNIVVTFPKSELGDDNNEDESNNDNVACSDSDNGDKSNDDNASEDSSND